MSGPITRIEHQRRHSWHKELHLFNTDLPVGVIGYDSADPLYRFKYREGDSVYNIIGTPIFDILSDQVTNLENHEKIVEVFEYIGTAASGTVENYGEDEESNATGATVYDIFQDGIVDALCVKADANDNPTEELATNGIGEDITVTSINEAGAYVLSDTPAQNACLVYYVKIKEKYRYLIPNNLILGSDLELGWWQKSLNNVYLNGGEKVFIGGSTGDGRLHIYDTTAGYNGFDRNIIVEGTKPGIEWHSSAGNPFQIAADNNILYLYHGVTNTMQFNSTGLKTASTNGARIVNEIPSNTNPVFLPYGEPATGIGGLSNRVSIIANSISVATFGDGADPKLVADPAGMYGETTGYWFSAAKTGIYETSEDVLMLQFDNVDTLSMSSSGFSFVTDYGPLMAFEVASGTNPVWTFKNDDNTGIGLYSPDSMSLIAGGNEIIRITQTSIKVDAIVELTLDNGVNIEQINITNDIISFNDDTVQVWEDTGVLYFKDTVTGTKSLEQLSLGTGGGSSTFLDLTDVSETTYVGKGGMIPTVKTDESGIEFTEGSLMHIYLDKGPYSEGDIHLSDASTWNSDKAVIKNIEIDTSSTDWELYILQNDNGYSADDAVIPAQLLAAYGNGKETIELDHAYEDEDASKELHLYWLDNSGSNAVNIIVQGYKLN